MSRIFDFEIEFGQIVIEAENSTLRGAYETTWNLLTNFDLKYEEWVIVFNLLGPAMAREVKILAPKAPARMIAEYIKTIGEDDPEVLYMLDLEDESSKFTHVLRAKFEVILKAAKASGNNSQAVIDKHSTELKVIFGRIPKYCMSAVYETLMIYRNR